MTRFSSFPKKRSILPLKFQKLYKEHYKNNRKGNTLASSLAQKMESWLHLQVAADLKASKNILTLEIGAGTLNQLMYEPIHPYDIVEPFEHLFEDSTELYRIRNIYKDIEEIKGDKIYDRITSVATLEHITNLPTVVAKSCLLMKEGATFRASIPNEGTFLWTLGWRLTTGLEFWLKNRLDYGILMKHEHVNDANEIEKVLEYFFENVKCKVFGVSKKVALYRFYECSKPLLNNAETHLNIR